MKHEVKVPSPGESISEVFIGTWLKKTGDIVKKGDVLLDLETQKATIELEAEQSGELEVLVPSSGAKVFVGDVIATIDDSVQKSDAAPSSAKPAATSVAAPIEAPLVGPAARKMMAEQNVDASQITGTGKGGRILKEDVMAAGNAPKSVSAPERPVPVPPMAAPAKASAAYTYTVDVARGDRRVPATRLRRQIADNLVKAQHTAAILTTFNEVDMSSVMAFRKKYKDNFKAKHGVSLGMVGLFALACVRALKASPAVNAYFTGEDILYHDYVDLSVAVSTDRGLVVPVMRDIDKMDIVTFEKTLAAVSEKARAGKLSIPDMTGGTFTISNGGVFGSLLSTPLLNMPQSAILGLHKIQDRPIVVDGQIVVRPMMYVALSYDHRIIDGKDAVQFLVAVKDAIENLDLIVDQSKL